MTKKELKQEIKKLKKLKLKLRSGSPERIELHRKIKELKNTLTEQNVVTPDKQKLIDKIYKSNPIYKTIQQDLNKFTIEQLQSHLDKINTGRKYDYI